MEKRTILAIALSLLVLLSWSLISSKFYPTDNKAVTVETLEKPSAVLPEIPSEILEEEVPPGSLIKISKDKYELVFIEAQGAVKEVIFPSYQNYVFSLSRGFLLTEPGLLFKRASSSNDEITFVHTDKTKKVVKHFTLFNSNYSIELEIKVQNLSGAPIKTSLNLLAAELSFAKDQNLAHFQDATAALKEKTLHLNVRKAAVFEDVKFLGWRDKYFCGIIQPEVDDYIGSVTKINAKESAIALNSKEFVLAPGEELSQKFAIYLGPQELKTINAINPGWTQVMYFGTFDFISRILIQLLGFLYNLVHSWGWTIILLSVIIYILLYPLTLKQMRSMKQMHALQPRIEELRKTFKDNPQKLNKEIMGLYREYKVNPFSGCLPLLLQMPIFFALYQALMRSVDLKGANFLWIKDLSEPDRLFILPTALPILGNEINILPILMTVGMFIQQKISNVSTSGASAEQQKLMMIIFPLMFGFIFYHMPSGLVLYWFVNSALMLAYQFRINRLK